MVDCLFMRGRYYGHFLLMNADVNHAVEVRTSQWLPFSMRGPNEKIYLGSVIIFKNCNNLLNDLLLVLTIPSFGFHQSSCRIILSLQSGEAYYYVILHYLLKIISYGLKYEPFPFLIF